MPSELPVRDTHEEDVNSVGTGTSTLDPADGSASRIRRDESYVTVKAIAATGAPWVVRVIGTSAVRPGAALAEPTASSHSPSAPKAMLAKPRRRVSPARARPGRRERRVGWVEDDCMASSE